MVFFQVKDSALPTPHVRMLISIASSSRPQSFWHQGLVLWKTIFPWTGVEGTVSGWFEHITLKLTPCRGVWFLIGPDRHQSAARRMGSCTENNLATSVKVL